MRVAKAVSDRMNRQILSRLKRLEAAVFGGARAEKNKQPPAAQHSGTLPARILELRESGFFNPARSPGEVHNRLSPKYPCELDRVVVALLRLQRRRALRRTSKVVNGKKLGAYVW